MIPRQHLAPVSFHLRDFNKYTTLDLDAAANGNLTLIGENATGKTTLANCFFPMLIDGSIATPSFNPAKGTERLELAGNPRNSARDTRNFEGMLLGWGSGSMKVRTGYSYMVLRSTTRQVILGIGAYRNVGEVRKPTWWFVVIGDHESDLQLVTTDNNGHGLGKEEFVATNQAIADQLTVFDQATEYREYVATRVYGFTSGEELGKLASAYRLLASPILTAGNARFTPIREALKNAQDGIDPQVIGEIADSQREVNQLAVLVKRIQRGVTRLKKMKKEIFWRNLNHLNEITLSHYSETRVEYDQNQSKQNDIRHKIKDYQHQLETGAPIQVQAEQDLQVLRDKRAVQKDIATRKKQYQDQISSLQARIQTYQLQQDQLSQLNKQLEELNRELNDMKAKQEQINLNQLKPIQAKLMAKTAQLPDLMKVATAADLTALGQGLINYVQQYTEAKHDFEAFTQMLQGLGSDVEIVTDMKNELDGRIDDRVQGMISGRIRTGLHQDNHEVHDAGAAKMNQQYRVVKNQQDQLLQQHTDLVKILAHPELLTEIQGFQIKITEINQELIQCAADINDINKEKKLHQAEATRIEHNMEDHFNVADVNDEINELYRLHDELVVDDELDDKIERAQNKYKQIKTSQQQFIKEMSALDGTLRTLVAESDKLSARLKGFVTEGQQDLQVLMPYAPINVKLTTVSEAIDFVAANRAEVRNNQYAEISDRVGRLIHRNDSNGVDLNALDVLFEERGHSTEASAMRQQRSLAVHNMTIVAFDLNHALDLLKEDQYNVQRALDAKKLGNDTAHTTYLQAASHLITDQYRLIESYNQMLSKGVNRDQSIRLKITLTPAEVNEDVIKEARDAHLQTQPALQAEIEKRLNKLANDTTIIDDDDFIQKAIELLDTRRWSTFKVLIKRRQNDEDNYEEVDDKFVQSGGSGAEKAQAMVLPLLLVPKMILQRATQKDTPYLVMFDEFADKLDPETAKLFAQTIDNFGFNFIATMPSGAQNKILADGVNNIAYDVIAPNNQDDGKFHKNQVRPALIWTR